MLRSPSRRVSSRSIYSCSHFRHVLCPTSVNSVLSGTGLRGLAGANPPAGTNRSAFAWLEQFRSPRIFGHGCGTPILWPWRGLFPVNESVQNDIQENQNDCLVKRDEHA